MSAYRGPKVFQVLGGPGAKWGGGGVVVLSITRRLIELGCSVWVLCLSEFTAERYREAGANIVTSRFWRRNISPFFDLQAFWELYRLCRKEKFEIVHTHTSKGGLLGRIAARLAGVPIILQTAHGFSFNELTPRLTTTFYVYLERLASLFGHTIISVTDQHRLMAIEKKIAKPDEIVTIHNGIKLTKLKDIAATENIRKELALPSKAILIGTVGRITPQKGQIYLMRAIPQIIRTHPQTHWLFIGDGPQEAELRGHAAELGVADHCTFMGFRNDVPELIACLDIFVQPSPREGLSISLLEAMAAKKPVIATDITGNQEVIDNGISGILCQPMDSTALAEAIIDLIEDQEKACILGERAREKVEGHFDEQMMLKRTIEIYKSKIEDALPLYRCSFDRTL